MLPFILGLAAGAYFAEQIRDVVPVLQPSVTDAAKAISA